MGAGSEVFGPSLRLNIEYNAALSGLVFAQVPLLAFKEGPGEFINFLIIQISNRTLLRVGCRAEENLQK